MSTNRNPPNDQSHAILNSWKEIAGYLGRGVRTVQRWEQELQLPVHRIGKGKRSPVFATVHELKFWISTSDAYSGKQSRPALVLPSNGGKATTPIEISHRLLAESSRLVREVAETSVRQRRQAEILQKRIIEIASRLKNHT